MKNTPLTILALLLFFLNRSATAQTSTPETTWTAACINIKTGKKIMFSGGPNEFDSFDKTLREKTNDFKTEDTVYVNITFADTNEVLGDTLSYPKARHFWKNHSYLLNDCENISMGHANDLVWTGPQYNSKAVTTIDLDNNSIQGYSSYKMVLKEKLTSNGIAYLSRSINEDIHDFTLTSGPDQTWFFLYIYSTANSNASFRFRVIEADPNDPLKWDCYNYEILLNFSGWKQVAIRYSSMTLDNSTSDQKQDTRQIRGIYYQLLPKENPVPVSVNLDYMMILHSDKKRLNTY